ncbi:MAG: dihydropteroate synthase [Armatimonadota bacterium]
MIVIGELINGTRDRIAKAIRERDDEYISDLAMQQAEAGADFIDCNPGTVGDDEVKDMVWLVETVQEVTYLPISFDSPNVEAVKAALDAYHGEETPMINSITAEDERMDAMLDLVADSGVNIIALVMSDDGMPSNADDRVNTGLELINTLTGAGVERDHIFVDPVIAPLGTDHEVGREILEAIGEIHTEEPEVHITCGLSNISFGLPQRRLLNRIFLSQCVAVGLDSAILDPLDRELMATCCAAEALAGTDEMCMTYIRASRDGILGGE